MRCLPEVHSPLEPDPAGLEPLDGLDVLDAHRLHVLRAARVDVAVLLLDGRERVVLPRLREDGHDVRVRVEEQGREAGVSSLPRHEEDGFAWKEVMMSKGCGIGLWDDRRNHEICLV